MYCDVIRINCAPSQPVFQRSSCHVTYLSSHWFEGFREHDTTTVPLSSKFFSILQVHLRVLALKKYFDLLFNHQKKLNQSVSPIFVDSFTKVEGQNIFPKNPWDVSGLSRLGAFRNPAGTVLFCSLNRRPIIFASSWIEATRRDSAGAKMGRSWPGRCGFDDERRCFGPRAGNFRQEKMWKHGKPIGRPGDNLG